jgi:SAM-dependent methyltransferase
MGDTVAWAVAEAFTPAQREAFEAHVARLMLHYLSPLDEDTAKLLGKPLTDGAAVLAARADVAQGKVERGLPAIIDELMRGCTQHEKKYRHYLERTSWRVLADHGVLRQHAAGAKSVLDVGAVPPLLAALLRVDGMDAAVADPGADAFGPYCDARGIAWANADLLAGHDPFPGRQFDLVCFCEVLEHLTGDVLGALDRVIDKVTPGGLLYVTTPNLRSVSGLVALLWHGKGLASKWRETVRDQYARAAQGGGYYGHVREYTAGEVITLFENLGFEHLASAYQTHPRAETPGRKVIQNVEWMFPTWALYGKHVFRRKTNSERKEN